MAHSFIYTNEDKAMEKAKTLITHPLDFSLVTNENFDPSKRANKGLTVDAAREVIKSAYISPIGEAKVMVFPNAELITINAQNALLKLIEEPPANIYFFFITTTPNSLLSTILSRSEIVQMLDIRYITLPTKISWRSNKMLENETLVPLCLALSQSQSAKNRYALEFALTNLKDNKLEAIDSLENIFLWTNNQTIDMMFKSKMQKRIAMAKQQLKSNCNWQSITWQLTRI